MNFRSHYTYNILIFKEDVELSLIVMIANIIGDIGLFTYLNKSELINKMFNIEK
ncbi:hypothetical protein [Winogradskyella sp. SYSU M77433]|uniref:hypothetical protein n=1 Tax=Winogradskyella sp. SYSU M77433 TaxID=3042722 RepID=UPI0024800553|nr:hypothetical protein [Winogradskyella sp. SYSU M77433]MDH7913621.1 hypothetical protein [Winogradskyella sp. SYSU M77433]